MIYLKRFVLTGKACFASKAEHINRIRHFSATPKVHSNVKTAILMLNMGGPEKTEQVGEYLKRIMLDTDMVQLPFQSLLGPFIAKKKTPETQKKYKEIGGGSSLLKWSQIQGKLLCEKLDNICPDTAPHKPYIAFRYADPLTDQALEDIERDKVKKVIIFSQYPQYSCSTSGSSFNAIYTYFSNKNKFPKDIEWHIIDRWATHPLFIKTYATLIKEELKTFPENVRDHVLILFSAHSLPLKIVCRGDSYPSEIGASCNLIVNELNLKNPYSLVWQSKVGPIPWLGPFTDDAIRDYVKQGQKNFLLVPIAFINEHVETLHELDIEYCQDLKKETNLDIIRRVATPNDHPLFIDALADIVAKQLKSKSKISKKFLMKCPHCVNPRCHSAKQWFAELCA